MSDRGFSHRIAFGVWINDIRNQPLARENWPAVTLDGRTAADFESTVRLLKQAGYTALDVFGLLTNHDWPVQIETVIGPARRKQVERLLAAARRHGLPVIYGLGVYSWGFDAIIRHDPRVRGTNPSAMCGSRQESREWMRRVVDFVAGNFQVDGFHLEAADQGRCKCADCGRETALEYYSRLNRETAEYLRERYPDKLLLVNTSGYLPWGDFVSPRHYPALHTLGKTIDVLIDGGNHGLFIHPDLRREFIAGFPAQYGTSGGFWIYPPQRWDRLRWFLPYTRSTAAHLKSLHADGSRACELYLGPLANPSTEMNVFCSGRLATEVSRDPAEVLAEGIELLYRPKAGTDNTRIRDIFLGAEQAFFEAWSPRRNWGLPAPYTDGIEPLFEWSKEHPERAVPGELFLEPLLGSAPGFPSYLAVHLNRAGRGRYRAALRELQAAVSGLGSRFRDAGRIRRIRRSLAHVLRDLDAVDAVKELP